MLLVMAAAQVATQTLTIAAAATNPPFERARTLLALGMVRRRGKQKRAAREALEQAAAVFDRLGARLWAARTTAELARIGGRASSVGALTPTERRVAELVADGHTNREVADRLFLSTKTVAAHLTSVYAKLGVRSRTELAHRLRGGAFPGPRR
jgi:DNA-binding CsgD family transcriptional regulator